MNVTMYLLELKRYSRDYVGLFFTAVLPAFFFVVFGAAQSYSDQPVGETGANVGLYIMVSMAAYGAVTATVTIGGSAAVERMQGWGRQLGLTPLKDVTLVVTKAVFAMTVALIPVGLVFVIGGITGAAGPAQAWIVSAVVILLGAAIFSVYGLIFGFAFRSESAVGAASGSLVVLAFLGNIFFPLSGTMLTIAKFTPLYGYVSLARRALTDGYLLNGTDGKAVFEPAWQPITGFAVWTVLFCVLAIWAVRMGRRRQ